MVFFGVVGVVGKSDSKENPKSNLDLDLGFVNWLFIIDLKQSLNLLIKTLAYILLQVRPAQHRPFQVGQIFTLIGFGPANCSQIFDGYEFTSKISRQI